MKTLRDVAIGKTAVVVKLHGEGAVKRRIMDMGVTKGTSVYVRKVAPLGGKNLPDSNIGIFCPIFKLKERFHGK